MSYKEEKRKLLIKIQKLIVKCVLEKDIEERVKYGTKITSSFHIIEKYLNDTDGLVDDLITRLSKAAETIVTQDDWLDYLEIAMGDQKDDIINKASLEREAVERYKKKYKRG